MLKETPNLRVVHLKSEDTLRSVLSWMIARENDTYIAQSERVNRMDGKDIKVGGVAR